MKHIPFQSHYRENFEVVEERHGHVRLYPHTDQLPLLLRALNLEFLGGLPDRLARVDKRADGFRKIILRHAALMYCASLNAARPDRLTVSERIVSASSSVAMIVRSSVERPIRR